MEIAQYEPAPCWFLHFRGIGEALPELEGDSRPASRAMLIRREIRLYGNDLHLSRMLWYEASLCRTVACELVCSQG